MSEFKSLLLRRTERSKCPPSPNTSRLIERAWRSRLESWPNEFALQIIYTDRDLRHHMSQWVAANQQPTCNFIPSRPRNADQRDMTVTTFRLLSKLLIESHTVRFLSGYRLELRLTCLVGSQIGCSRLLEGLRAIRVWRYHLPRAQLERISHRGRFSFKPFS